MTPNKQALLNALSEDLILALTTRMVSIPTRNPPGEEKACAMFIYETLREWGIEAELVEAPDPERPQVVGWVRGHAEGPTFILNGHIDTVPEGDREQWSSPPHEPTRRGDRLYGLGTCDMKGSLACAMAMMKALVDSGARLPGSLMFQAVMGEEMDEPGTKTLLQLGYVGDCAITMEPTNSRIGPGTRGACWHRVTLSGPAVHCGLAETNAPDVMHALARLAGEIETYHEAVASQEHHLLASPACRITTISGGETHNSTAGSVELMVDRRMLPHETTGQVGEDLRAMLDRATAPVPGVSYTVAPDGLNEATETPLDSPLVGAIARNHRLVHGTEAEVWGPPYGSDMRNFIVDAGIPCVNFGAGDFQRCHQPDEFVPLSDLYAVARVTFATVLDFIAGDDNRGLPE